MNRVRRICAAVLLAAAVGIVAVAGASAAPAAQLKIAFVGADLPDPFYLTMKCGAFAAAKKYNVDLSWQGTDGVDFAPELAIYNATVQKKPDGIIVAPFSPTAFVKPVADTMKAGTPVVTVDGSLSKKVELQNIRTDNLKAGVSPAPASARCSAARGRSPSCRSRRTSRCSAIASSASPA